MKSKVLAVAATSRPLSSSLTSAPAALYPPTLIRSCRPPRCPHTRQPLLPQGLGTNCPATWNALPLDFCTGHLVNVGRSLWAQEALASEVSTLQLGSDS